MSDIKGLLEKIKSDLPKERSVRAEYKSAVLPLSYFCRREKYLLRKK